MGLLLFQLLELIVGVAAHVAHGDLGVFAVLAGDLDQLLAAFFGQRRNGDADNLAVIDRSEAEVGLQNGLFHSGECAAVPGLNGDCPTVRHGDGGQLTDGGRRAVIVDLDGDHKAGGGTTLYADVQTRDPD